jgi:hypothetical protein
MESGHTRLSIGDGGQTRECRQDLLQGTRNFTMEVTMMQESGFKPVGAVAFMVTMVLFYALVWLISYAFVIAWR